AETGNEKVKFQPELNYIQKGYTTRQFNGSARNTITYLDVPLLVKVNVAHGNNTTFYLLSGITPGYGLSGRGKANDQTDKLDWDREGFRRFDFGIPLGASVNVASPTGALVLDARYHFGIANIIDDTSATLRNRGFTLSVGYRFGK
ncbi:MAG: porin family protein, partial [Saprospiraceae bacterium]